jgi:hypothetical protein
MATRAWRVTRRDEEVRVDVTESASLEQSDAEAIAGAAEKQLAEDHTKTVRFSSPLLNASRVPDTISTLILYLGRTRPTTGNAPARWTILDSPGRHLISTPRTSSSSVRVGQIPPLPPRQRLKG